MSSWTERAKAVLPGGGFGNLMHHSSLNEDKVRGSGMPMVMSISIT